MTLDQYLRQTNTTSRTFAEGVKASIFAVHKWRRHARIPRRLFIKRIEHMTSGKVKPKDWYQ